MMNASTLSDLKKLAERRRSEETRLWAELKHLEESSPAPCPTCGHPPASNEDAIKAATNRWYVAKRSADVLGDEVKSIESETVAA